MVSHFVSEDWAWEIGLLMHCEKPDSVHSNLRSPPSFPLGPLLFLLGRFGIMSTGT